MGRGRNTAVATALCAAALLGAGAGCGEEEKSEVVEGEPIDLGAAVAPDSEVPAPDSAAASGPVKGAMALFLVDEGISENRPLELEILAEGEEGRVELDI